MVSGTASQETCHHDDGCVAGRGAPVAAMRQASSQGASCSRGARHPCVTRTAGGLPTLSHPTLHICTTCRAGLPLEPGQTAPGQHMHDAVAALLAAAPAGVELRAVTCLSSCDNGCAAAISQPGKWSYLLGRLDTSLAPDLLAYAGLYAAHRTGTVLPSKRPPSLARMVLGRLPDLSPVATEMAAGRNVASAVPGAATSDVSAAVWPAQAASTSPAQEIAA